jgi:DNA-binding transcriptional regulator YiaG
MSTQRVSLHLTPASLDTLDAGIYPGGGRSQRVNGILQRYALAHAAVEAQVAEKFSDALPTLASAYFSDGNAGSWLRGWASTQVEIAMEARGSEDWQAIAAESPVIDAVLSASDAELSVLEELLARRFAKPASANIPCTPENVIGLRLEVGLTQPEAAEFAGVSLRTWQTWESTGQLPPGRWEELVVELSDPQTRLTLLRDRSDRPAAQKPRNR